MTSLNSKVVMLTGAAGGIGSAVARRLHQAGATLVLLDRQLDAMRTLLKELGTGARAVAAEVTVKAEIEQAFDDAEKNVGACDVLVHCAGIGVERDFLETSTDEWRRLVDVNLTGTFICCQAAVRRMTASGRPGSIVTIASTAGELGSARRAAYGASKAGVINLTQSIAVELAGRGIRANVVSPGPIETALVKSMHSASARAAFTSRVPMGRYGTPEEVAEAVLFLASDASGFVNGHVLHVDGGFKAAGIMHQEHL